MAAIFRAAACIIRRIMKDFRLKKWKPARVHLLAAPNVIERSKNRLYIRHITNLKQIPLDGRNPEMTLKRGIDLLNSADQYNMELPRWWIGVGTALGFSREADFIESDTDIDIRIGLDYQDCAAAQQYSNSVIAMMQNNNFRLIREMYWEYRPMQSAFYDTQNNDVILDIYYFYKGVTEGCYVNYFTKGYREKPERFIQNLRTLEWPRRPDILVNVPWPIEEYNEWRWGPDWRIKKKKCELTERDMKCIKPLPIR